MPRFLLRFFPVLLLLALAAFPGRATHIVGGELDLQYQSGSTYRINLNLYFDAVYGNPGALDSDLSVGIFEKGTDRRMQNLNLPLVANTSVVYSDIACTLPILSTRRIQYSSLITLPADKYTNPTGYYAAVERCCRNNSIRNIRNPGDAGQTYYLEFPAVVRNGQPFINSTPRIFPPLSDYACRGELFYYDFGGQDVDGDSLVYELSTPLNGHSNTTLPKPVQAEPQPYSPIQWIPGLHVLNQIPGTPALSVNRFSGRLEVRPSNLGLHVFGIKCSEYRKGVKISEVRRDFQLQVIDCPRNIKPKVNVYMPGTNRPYQPEKDVLQMAPGNRCFKLRFTDPDPTSRLTLSMRPVNFTTPLPTFSLSQGMVRTAGAPDTLISEMCFSKCLDTKGKVYLLDVIVADNGCSLPKRDTVRVAFTSVPDPNSPPVVTTTAGPTLPLNVRIGDLVTFQVLGQDPDSDNVALEMTGKGFTPGSVGATMVQNSTGPQVRGTFSWRVPCPPTDKFLYEFEFTAAATPCDERQVSAPVVVPIQINYANTPPILTASDAAPVIRHRMGEPYTLTLEGLDADNDALVLSATANGIDLAEAGMRFTARNGPGKATATFEWDPSCTVAQREITEVTFLLQESTCRPVPVTQKMRFEVVRPQAPNFMPANIFTPNNDQLNDFFELPTLPPDFCDSRLANIKIFSRWGNLVYQTTNRTFKWDGGGLPAGVYFLLIEYTDKSFKGTVTIAP
ncbi:gliding motility-associated C-terminal domain-containing protein [Hymenobacter cellulosilyticus]|uniref:Gliding motility-associated C-terminal domain-containing protein n=1 Tax=Hymenobacter cellulosilyticus TaxID=2932248 RepID=A0A8T9PZ58_9BACT|nr:gliding motility-associated C-terminal domain-containing protein [Hymenobacter cellulosilyticus]UOQ70736.1 gliding motility-associated C-terminal domain-containing protein [Hymenobacter cellulosilyticus]